MQDMTKLNFYLMYLELLDKEINKTKNIELKDDIKNYYNILNNNFT